MKLSRDPLLHKLGGYYLIPHELLHVFAYRLIGKPCHYEWGDWQVKSLAHKTRRESLFVLLMPFVVPWLIGLICYGIFLVLVISMRLPLEQYVIQAPRWHFIFPLVMFVSIMYTHTCGKDLIQVFGWLFIYKTEEDSSQPHQASHEQQIHGDKP